MLKRYLYIITLVSVLVSCKLTGNKNDISSEKDVEVARYDRLQYEYVATNSIYALQQMNTEFPQATKILIEDVLSIGKVDDERINERMMDYFCDTTLLAIMQDAQSKFKDIAPIEKQIDKGFRKLKKELPDITIPKVYAQFSGLNQSIVVGDSLLGFSIDKYMGSDYPLYKRFYYDFQTRFMSKDRIARDCFVFYLQSEYPISAKSESNLVDLVLYKGKINWIVSNILEYDNFDKELGYSKKESKWCRENQDTILKEIFHKGKLSLDDKSFANKYINQDSLKLLLGNDAPPALGIWLGAELVDRYMKQNSNMSIGKLMDFSDYQKMLSDINIKL